ncbi:MAG: helix-turn-helix transcriptional regulator [Oscillospiraceae bacterium]|nr:helix-turn-helix transcriptional regulator [Oscillospiraceae bacterium]
MYMPEIGQKIKRLRTQRGISQIDLSTQLGVSKSVVSSYENGIHLPPYDVLIKIALLFDVSTDYLLGLQSHQTINVDGLSNTQIEAISLIVNELKGH